MPVLSGVKPIRRPILFRNGRQEEMLRRHRLILVIRLHFNHPPAAAISIRLIFLLLHLQIRRTTTIRTCSTLQRRLRSIRMSIRTRIIRLVEHSMSNQRRVPRRTAVVKRRLLRMSLVRRFLSSVFSSSRQLIKRSQKDNESESSVRMCELPVTRDEE